MLESAIFCYLMKALCYALSVTLAYEGAVRFVDACKESFETVPKNKEEIKFTKRTKRTTIIPAEFT